MPWNITNRQLDPMTLTLDDGTVANAQPGVAVAVNSGVQTIEYHKLRYTRHGIWPFPANQNVDATYGGQQNCYVRNPVTAVEAVYPYAGP